jgi:hypothetical protein
VVEGHGVVFFQKRKLRILSYQPSAISRQLSAVSYQPSAISRQLSAVSRQLSAISRQLSDIIYFKVGKPMGVVYKN